MLASFFRSRPTWWVLVLLAAVPAGAAADPSSYTLDVDVAYRYERFNSPLADSLHLAVGHAVATRVGFDFRVFSAPMPGAAKPALHVFGGALTSRRTVANASFSTGGGAAPVEELPVAVVEAGIRLVAPLTLVDPGAGSALFLGYQGGLALTSFTSRDLMRTKHAVLGFERTVGQFEGSRVEMRYGRNETVGRADAAGRWVASFHVESALARGPRGAPAGSPAGRSPLRLYVELAADTDGGDGPDLIEGQAGIEIDAGHLLRKLTGASE